MSTACLASLSNNSPHNHPSQHDTQESTRSALPNRTARHADHSLSQGFCGGGALPPAPFSAIETSPSGPAMDPIPPRVLPRRQKAAAIPPPPPFAPIHTGSVIENFREALDGVDVDMCAENGENAFYVCDLAEVYRQALRWHRGMEGRVQPFYAIKCNPDAHVLRLLAAMGMGFDCASHAEITSVLSLGIDPSRIIYANPCKAASFIRNACAAGVRMMTFDNADELSKVARFHPSAQLVLRILTDDSGSLCRFGDKFGAPLAAVRPLLERAKQLGLDVVGVSFHVGSGCSNPDLYVDAIGRAKSAFETAASLGYVFDFLDIGGGFGHHNFESLAEGAKRGLDKYFPAGCGVRVIAEPGRYFVAEAFELATNVIARRSVGDQKHAVEGDEMVNATKEEKPATLYYINDGVYGAFNCIMFDHQVVQPQVLTLGGVFQSGGLFTASTSVLKPAWGCEEEKYLGLPTPAPSSRASERGDWDMEMSVGSLVGSTPGEDQPDLEECKIFGPSCDSIDLVCPEAQLPVSRLDVGDWLRWRGMGAYTICAASQFNGFRLSEVRYTIDGKGSAVDEARVLALVESVGNPLTPYASQDMR